MYNKWWLLVRGLIKPLADEECLELSNWAVWPSPIYWIKL